MHSKEAGKGMRYSTVLLLEASKKAALSAMAAVLLLAFVPCANSQTVSGQISGVIVDPQNAAVPGPSFRCDN